MSKRGRDDEPQHRSQDVEQRLVNLIVKVGDKGIATQLTSHLKSLASALEGDLLKYDRLIVDTILDCGRCLHAKATVYGTLAGLLNLADADFGASVVKGLRRELQDSLEDHAPMAIRGLTRFAVELMNARALSPESVVEMLETYLGQCRDESVPAARADWFCILVMDALVFCGKTLAAEAGAALERMMSAIKDHASARSPLAAAAPLLLPFGAAATASDALVEHFDALYSCLTATSDDGSWASAYVLSPYRAFGPELSGATTHALGGVVVPAHTPGLTYPTLHRLRLLPAPATVSSGGGGGGDAAMEDADGGGGGGGGGGGRADGGGEGLSGAERVVLEEQAYLIVSGFSASHKDCAKLLLTFGEEMRVELSTLLVEVLLSLLLTLPEPKHKAAYYACVIIDLCKALTPFPLALEAALHALFAKLPALDAQLADRLAEWLALHVSHFDFSLRPFEAPWAAAIAASAADGNGAGAASAGGDGDASAADDASAVDPAAIAAAAASAEPRASFVRTTLEHMVRLSYIERVGRHLPPTFASLMPPKPAGRPDWDEPKEGDLAPGSPASLSAGLLSRLRNKQASEQVVAWVDGELAAACGAVPRVALVAQTLLHAGAKSVSHLEKLLDKFGWLLTHVGASEHSAKTALVGAGLRYWHASPQMCALLVTKLLHAGIVDPAAVLAAVLAEERLAALAAPATWGIVDAALSFAVRRQSAMSAALSDAERAAEDRAAARQGRSIDDDDDGAPLPMATDDDDEVNACKSAHERARRETKAAFANLFASVCGLLGGGGADGRGAGALPQSASWRAAVLGRAHGVARIHRHEFSLATAETVAEGAEVDAAVREEVFGPLRQLATVCG